MFIFSILVLPIISILIMSISKRDILIKYVPILITTLSLLIVFQFIGTNDLINNSNFENLYVNFYTLVKSLDVNMSFEINRINVLFIFLSHITIITAFFSTIKVKSRLKQINILISLISIGIYGLILSSNLFVFFLFYEIAAIPIFLMISNWGYDLKREISGPFSKALNFFNVGSKNYGSYKITIYLFIASLLIFIGIAIIGSVSETFEISSIIQRNNNILNSSLVFFLFLIGFGTHSALWPFHTWAPDGHGTAPTAGSIIFAGILMKIGLVGFIKILLPIMPEVTNLYAWLIISLASINIIYGAFTAMRQDDLKFMAAYASLSHIGYIFFALMTSNISGIQGAIFQVISHGLIICLLFFCVGCIHKLKGTRSISELNSFLDNSPILAGFFIFCAFASIGFPLTSGFISEFLIINGIYKFYAASTYKIIMIMIPVFGILLTTVYMFRAIKNTCLNFSEKNLKFDDLSFDEILICIVLCILIIFIGLFPDIIQAIISNSYKGLIIF